jgi:hypothetical protein
MVGFHDFLSILVSGHKFKGKLSGKDNILLPFLAEKLTGFEPGFGAFIEFRDERIGPIEAMIATGSNNTSRYFEYYFGKYPHVFRKNRNGIAVLNGEENDRELAALADDVFLYFGMGCRNVAKIYVPEAYGFERFYRQCDPYAHLIDHHKYANNYLYQRSVFLMNQVKHLDNGFLIIRPDEAVSSPVATLHFEEYAGPENLTSRLSGVQESVQCVVSAGNPDLPVMPGKTVPMGMSQSPGLMDYSDNVDTLIFLSNL